MYKGKDKHNTEMHYTFFYFKLILVLFILRFHYGGVEVNHLLRFFFNSSSCDLNVRCSQFLFIS